VLFAFKIVFRAFLVLYDNAPHSTRCLFICFGFHLLSRKRYVTLENVSVKRKQSGTPTSPKMCTTSQSNMYIVSKPGEATLAKPEVREPEVNTCAEDDRNSENREAVKKLTIKDLSGVLEELHLGQYAKSFEENSVDGEILSSLSVDDLVSELSLKKLEAIRLYKFVKSGHVPK